MADSKITALTALTAADPANDMIPIVDVSDTPPASGNTKRISINNLLACSPSATLASATITGALTVDTTTLVVDPTNDRVGIGTATPAAKLIVRDGSNRNLLVSSDATQLGSAGIAIGSFTDNAAGYAPLSIIAGTSMAFGMNGTTAMTLNSTGLGVGASPANDKLLSLGSIGILLSGATSDFSFRNSGGTAIQRLRYTDATGALTIGSATATAYPVELGGNTTTRAVTIDASSNVGIGVTPSAWTPSDRALQFAYGNSIATATSTNFSIVRNAQELAGGWTYSANGFSQLYNLESDGGYKWYTAASGTAGNVVSFGSAKMTLDTLGNLILLSPSTPPTLATNGQLTVNATSNTNLRFSYRGSDGVTRTANLTLA